MSLLSYSGPKACRKKKVRSISEVTHAGSSNSFSAWIITKVAPTFDYIENKAIEEEHRKGLLSNQPADANAMSSHLKTV
jgi:hypothetical protein